MSRFRNHDFAMGLAIDYENTVRVSDKPALSVAADSMTVMHAIAYVAVASAIGALVGVALAFIG